MGEHAFQAPTGTRDFYPADLLRRRYVEKAWRDTSIRHGFEEIDGPTFEHLELYTAKSGEGIVGEVFSFRRGGGEKDYALRPEFTPTLARMFAARAGSLPRPTRWFWQQNCFRAERPQRGRLREFGQWNVDVIGDADATRADSCVIACCVDLLAGLGLGPGQVRVKVSDRRLAHEVLGAIGIEAECHEAAMGLLDRAGRLTEGGAREAARAAGFPPDLLARYAEAAARCRDGPGGGAEMPGLAAVRALTAELASLGLGAWIEEDFGIVRGLAYYTGVVFEVAAEGERAIAGGGRYDGLIPLFNGPPEPAVGFGMGDAVLSLVLGDRGLIPEGGALLDAAGAPGASLRPDVFVMSNGTPGSDAAVRPLAARLRRGTESPGWRGRDGRRPWDLDRYAVRPLHARYSSRQTRNLGKLLKEAGESHARFAAIVESASEVTLKNLGSGEQSRLATEALGAAVAPR